MATPTNQEAPLAGPPTRNFPCVVLPLLTCLLIAQQQRLMPRSNLRSNNCTVQLYTCTVHCLIKRLANSVNITGHFYYSMFIINSLCGDPLTSQTNTVNREPNSPIVSIQSGWRLRLPPYTQEINRDIRNSKTRLYCLSTP